VRADHYKKRDRVNQHREPTRRKIESGNALLELAGTVWLIAQGRDAGKKKAL